MKRLNIIIYLLFISFFLYARIEYKQNLSDVKESYNNQMEDITNIIQCRDTVYKSVDTTVMHYSWGREEIYIYKYN